MSDRRGPIIGGMILIGLGALFLARELVPGFDLSDAWPVASVILGIVLIVFSFGPGRPAP